MNNLNSVAFPYGMSCGLGGLGWTNWVNVLDIIKFIFKDTNIKIEIWQLKKDT